jgi:hypothetical protein
MRYPRRRLKLPNAYGTRRLLSFAAPRRRRPYNSREAQRDELNRANLIRYLIKDGQLRGATLNSSFFASFTVNPDNKLNKAVYGIKSSETLQGKQPAVQAFPPSVLSYQQSLLEIVR